MPETLKLFISCVTCLFYSVCTAAISVKTPHIVVINVTYQSTVLCNKYKNCAWHPKLHNNHPTGLAGFVVYLLVWLLAKLYSTPTNSAYTQYKKETREAQYARQTLQYCVPMTLKPFHGMTVGNTTKKA